MYTVSPFNFIFVTDAFLSSFPFVAVAAAALIVIALADSDSRPEVALAKSTGLLTFQGVASTRLRSAALEIPGKTTKSRL